MKIKTSDLIGPALDWAVAKCEGRDYRSHECTYATDGSGKVWAAGTCPSEDRHSTDWAQGGPIIEREKITWTGQSARICRFARGSYSNVEAFGPTPLIAALRCLVASKLGDEVEVPDELIGA